MEEKNHSTVQHMCKTLAVSVSVLVVAVLGFSMYYYSLLNIEFRPLSIALTILATVAFSLVFLLIRSRIWKGVSIVAMGGFIVYLMTNLLFFQVFNSFLSGITSKAGDLGSTFPLLKSYIAHVPATFFIFAITIIILYIVVGIWYQRQVSAFSTFTKRQRVVLPAMFFVALLTPFFVTQYVQAHPLDSWWDSRNRAADLGIIGHIYTEVGKSVLPKDTVLATNNQELDNAYGRINSYIDQLASNRNVQTPPAPAVPAEKPHILIYQLESVDSWGIKGHNPSPMPYLQELTAENISVGQFFPNSCHTINAEFATLCSGFVDSVGAISDSGEENKYHCLPSILAERYDYTSGYFHSNTSTFWSRDVLGPKWGFDEMYFSPYYEQRYPDRFILDEMLAKMQAAQQPTLNFLVGYTSHSPHSLSQSQYFNEKYGFDMDLYRGEVNPDVLANIELNEYDTRTYMGFLRTMDQTIAQLFQKLEETGLADNTIVVITADHRYYNFPEQTAANFVYYNETPFVIITPEQYKGQVQPIASHIDIAPTLLNLIEGGQYDQPEHFVGRSLFADNHPAHSVMKCITDIGFANQHTIMRGSTNNGVYNTLSTDGSVDTNTYAKTLNALVEETDELIFQDKLLDY